MRLFLYRLLLPLFVIASLVSCKADNIESPNFLFVISDDQSWLHNSFSGEPGISTPSFDRIAAEGINFTHAHVSAPTCTASRSAVLAGQHFWRLGDAAVLWGEFGRDTLSYQQILQDAGYFTGYTGKGWGPGRIVGRQAAGRDYNFEQTQDTSRNLSDSDYVENFRQFLNDKPGNAPFSFWYSPSEPHRPLANRESYGIEIDTAVIRVPEFLPDNSSIREDLANYYAEIEWQDRALGRILLELEERDLMTNTIIIVTSDNGMPFPRAKSTNYEYGTRVPLAIKWQGRIEGNTSSDAIVNLSDLAPTILDAAGLSIPAEMTGRNLSTLFETSSVETAPIAQTNEDFSYTVTGFERHLLNARSDNATYPSRAIHTKFFSYIRNFRPDRWPAGDPPNYRDIDGTSPSRDNVLTNPDRYFLDLATAKRPMHELYDLLNDPYQLTNLANNPEFSEIRESLATQLIAVLEETQDPLLIDGPDSFHDAPYYGP